MSALGRTRVCLTAPSWPSSQCAVPSSQPFCLGLSEDVWLPPGCSWGPHHATLVFPDGTVLSVCSTPPDEDQPDPEEVKARIDRALRDHRRFVLRSPARQRRERRERLVMAIGSLVESFADEYAAKLRSQLGTSCGSERGSIRQRLGALRDARRAHRARLTRRTRRREGRRSVRIDRAVGRSSRAARAGGKRDPPVPDDGPPPHLDVRDHGERVAEAPREALP